MSMTEKIDGYVSISKGKKSFYLYDDDDCMWEKLSPGELRQLGKELIAISYCQFKRTNKRTHYMVEGKNVLYDKNNRTRVSTKITCELLHRSVPSPC